MLVERAVLQALDGDRQSTRQARGIDRKAFLPEKVNPLVKGDATQQAWPDSCQQSFPPVHVQYCHRLPWKTSPRPGRSSCLVATPATGTLREDTRDSNASSFATIRSCSHVGGKWEWVLLDHSGPHAH